MSRTGNMPIEIPDGIDVTLSDSNVIVKDKSGEKNFKFSKDLTISIEDKKILIKPKQLNKKTRMIWGTTRSLLNSIILGCINDFKQNVACGQYSPRARTIDMHLSIVSGNEISSVPDDPADNPDKGKRFLTYYNSTIVLRNL